MNTAAPDLLLEHHTDPYPYYRELRENDPVHFDERRGNWLVMRYHDVLTVLKDDARFSAEQVGDATSMLVSDPPKHTRLRGLVSQAFTPRRVRELRPRIEEIVEDLLDEAAGKPEVEVISEFAYPLPITVIAELLGVDKEKRDFFREATRGVALSLGATVAPELPMTPSEGRHGLREYFEELVELRRKEPKDDLVSALVQAEEEGDRLNRAELLSMLVLLLIGGHETTVNLVGNGLNALLHHRDQFERLRDSDIGKLAVDELLRFDSPVQYTGRVAKVETEIAGTRIKPGDGVRVILGSANRDPEVFDEPDRLDLTRDPCPHLSFGWGVHFCLGAELARLEGEVALAALVRRFPRMELAAEPIWRPATVLRGVEALHITTGEG